MKVFTEIISPLDQFEIRNLLSIHAPILGNVSISLTNIALYLSIAGFIILNFTILSDNYNRIISNRWSIFLETIYATIHGIVISQINDKRGQIYFPLIYVLFIFILTNNLIGMVPYSFAATSHLDRKSVV